MPPRILHLTFDMRIGGTEQVIKNLIEGNDPTVFDMSIYCIEQPIGPFGQLLSEKGISINGTNRKPGLDFSVISSLRRHIKQNNIDIIHCHQYTPWVYGTFAAIGTGIKIVFTEHGRFYPDRSSWKRRYINPVLAMLTDRITAISQATRQALVDYEYLSAGRIDVIYNGIVPLESNKARSTEARQSLGISDSSFVLGTIARLDPIKNHIMMLKAFRRVIDEIPDCVLIIVGDGEERRNIETEINHLGLDKNVILTGYISQPVDYLECMDIFLLSSLSEGTSMTLLEAMSLSKPCVVTHAGGNPEIINDNDNGYVTPNDDPHAFANAIIKLFKNRSLLTTMARNSYSRFLQLYNVPVMEANYHKLYQSIL